MTAFSNVTISPALGTPSGQVPSQIGPITSSTGDEQYFTRWATGDAALRVKGTLTLTSGDIFSGVRHYVEVILWKDGDSEPISGWGIRSSNYRTTAGALVFDIPLTTPLLLGTKYFIRVRHGVQTSPDFGSGYPLTSKATATRKTSFFTNRSPETPVITSPPTGVSIAYEDGVSSEFTLEWDSGDPDLVSGGITGYTWQESEDYLGYEVQYRPAPTPQAPNPAWTYFTMDRYYLGWTSRDSWSLVISGDTASLEWTDKHVYMFAKSDYGTIGVASPYYREPLAKLGPGTWQFRVRAFDYGGYGATTPGGVPSFSTSDWSDTVTINITAAFLPPLPLSPINDVAVVDDEVTFEWLFRDPRVGGGTQQSSRLRIRPYGADDTAWAEIIPHGQEITSWAIGGNPQGIAVSADGSAIYVTDNTASLVRKFSAAGVEQVTGGFPFSTVGVPRGIAVDATHIYVADSTTDVIRKFNMSGVQVATWSTTGDPQGVAVDATSVYVCDDTNNLIRKYSLTGTAGITFTTTGSPWDVALDGAGNIYVADFSNDLVRKYNSAGVQQTTWPTGATSANVTNGIAVDAAGSVYIASNSGFLIYKYTSTGTTVTSWSSTGSPRAITSDAAGLIYVADQTDDRVRVFDGVNAPLPNADQSYTWANGDGFLIVPGFRYEWQPRTVAAPGNFDSGFSGPTGTFWAIPAPGSGSVIPVPTLVVPDPGLGCGDNRAFLFTRGGINRLGEITQKQTIKWTRIRDDISSCNITITGWNQDCGELLKMMRSWMHEIVVYRDNGSGPKRVWEGPITRITYSKDTVEVEARDVWAYVYRRILRQGFNDSYRPGGGLTPVTRRSAQILQNALAYDDPNVLAYLSVIENPDDARQSRVVPDFSTTAWQQIDDFAAKSGLDYTAAGRKMILWDTHNPIGTLPEMRDGDFDTPPIVTEYGMQLTNFYGVTNNNGVYGTADRLDDDGNPEFYGWIEMLSSAYGESDEAGESVTLTNAAREALEAALTDQAERGIASRWPTPLVARVPDNSTLNPDVNIDINQLVPGVFVPLRANSTLREVVQTQKLDSMSVAQDGAGETVQVTLSPAPRSRAEDPDEGGEE